MDAPTEAVSSSGPRLVLPRAARFRPEVGAQIRVELPGQSFMLPRRAHDVLVEFSEAHTAAEVWTALDTDVELADFERFVGSLREVGLLVPPQAEPSPASPGEQSIDGVLRPGLLDQPRLRESLAAGGGDRMCVIRNAFRPEFAEAVAAALEAERGWHPYQDYSQPFFHYTHHNVYDESLLSGELRRCFDIFDSPLTKARMGELYKVDCDGGVKFGASLYLPGDYSLPHTDGLEHRTLAFVWHLTRDWKASWGGHLYWTPTQTFVRPTFNTLILFAVSDRTWHFVCPVSPYARSRRLTVNGWWTRQRPAGAVAADPGPNPRVAEDSEWLAGGAPPTELGSGVYLF